MSTCCVGIVAYGPTAAPVALARRLAAAGLRVRVCDNGGDFPDLDGVTVLRPGANLGFGQGANRLAADAETDWLVLVNPDAELSGADIRALVAAGAAIPSAAAIGPRLVYPDGAPQINGGHFSGVVVEVSRTLGIGRALRSLRAAARREGAGDADEFVLRPWVSGAVLALRLQAFRAVGGFDPRFHLYFEDEDLCRRLDAAGWVCGIATGVTAAHAVGGAGGARNPYRGEHYQRSRLAYHERHSPAWLTRVVRRSAVRILRGGERER